VLPPPSSQNTKLEWDHQNLNQSAPQRADFRCISAEGHFLDVVGEFLDGFCVRPGSVRGGAGRVGALVTW
jgi:hypothetical protein